MPDYNKKDVYLEDFDSLNAASSSATGLGDFDTKNVLQDIRSSYTQQKSTPQNKLKEALKEFDAIVPSSQYTYGAPVETKEKASFTEKNYNPGELYTTLRSGETVKNFETYTPGIDNYENHAQNQSTAEKWKNGAIKFAGQTVTGIVGGTLGTVYGIEEGIRQGSFRATYDNDFGNYLDDLNEKWDKQLPNYYKKAEQDMNFLESMGTANFWAKDVLGGAAFTVSAIGSELIWDYVTGGAALATSGARLGAKFSNYFGKGTKALGKLDDIAKAKNLTLLPIRNTFNKTAEASKMYSTATLPTSLATNFGKAGALANVARFTYTSAGFEAGFEARHYIREEEDKFFNDFTKKNGREPDEKDIAAFQENLTSAANSLYGFNLAVVGTSNLATIGKVFNIKSPLKAPSSWTNSKLFGVGVKSEAGELIAKQATRGQKFGQYAYSITKPMFIEGLYEEGLQSVGSNTAKKWVESKYDPTLTENTYTLGNAVNDSFSQTYGTKEGFKEVGIGMIVGMLAGHGVNLAKGRGLNAEFYGETYKADALANMSKYYSPKKMAETFAYGNRVQMSTNSETTAKQKGDFTGEELARQSSVIAQMNYAYNLDYMDEVVKDSVTAINNIDNESLMKQYGVDESGAEALKKSMVEEYKETADTYKKYRDFAEYYVGDKLKAEDSLIGKEGTLGEHTAKDIKEAIAYELTLGEKAHSFSGDLLQAIKEKVASTIIGEDISETMSIDDILTKAGKNAKIQADQKMKQVDEVNSEIEAVERDYKQLKKTYDDSVSDEEKKSILGKLDGLTSKKQELTEQKEKLRKEFEILVNTSKMKNPFNKDKGTVYVSGETLDNFKARSEQVKEMISDYSNINPQEALQLKKLIQEYGKALGAFQRYSELSRQLSDPKLGLRGRRNLIAELRSDKTPSEVTVETLEGLLSKEALSARGEQALVERAGEIESLKAEVEKVKEAAKSGASIPKPTVEEKQATREEEIQAIKDEYDAKIAELTQPTAEVLPVAGTKDEVAKLREQEQKDLLASIAEAKNALTDGKVDKNKLTNPEDIAKFEEIYDRYDKLITPLLKGQEGINLVSTPVADIVSELNKLSTLDEKLNWLKDNNLLSPININGKEYNLIDYSDRVMVLMKIGNYNIPFYISTGQAGKKNVKAGNWYAVFGIGVEKGWINKGSEEEINNSYGFQLFTKLSKVLNEGIGTIESRENNGNGKLKDGIGFLSDSKEDLEAFNDNMNLPTKPAGKNTDVSEFYNHVNSTLSLLNDELKNIASANNVAPETTKEDKTLEQERKKLEKERKDKIAEVEKKYPKSEEKKTLTDEIVDILENSPYLVEYVGTNISEIQPTDSEIERFRDLAQKAMNDSSIEIDTIAFKNPYEESSLSEVKNVVSLSKEEISELQTLNNKLANWQLLQVAANQSGVSVKQIIEQDIARRTVAPKKGPSSKLTDTELVTNTSITEDEGTVTEDGVGTRNEEAIQVAEGAFISKKKGGKRSIHYHTLPGLLRRMTDLNPNITIFKKEKVGNKEEVIDSSRKDIFISELENYLTPGYYYQLEFNDGTSIEVKMEKSTALTLQSQNDLDAFLTSAELEYVESTLNGNGGYIPLYDVTTGRKLNTDFEVEDGYSPSQIYDLSPGESVFFNLDMSDPYNVQLLEEYNQGIADTSRDPEEVLSDLADSIKINIIDSSDNLLGVLKANYDTRDLSNFITLRKKAAELALEPTSFGGKVTIPFTTTVKHIFLGAPNYSFEDGILKYYDIKPDLVKGYGYISNGELVLKGVKASSVRKEYVKKLYPREGTPVVVLQQGKYLVAFPLNLLETSSNLGEQFKTKIAESTNIADTVLELNQALLENGLSPKKYNLYFVSEENQTLFEEDGNSSEKLTQALEDLNAIKQTADVKSWMDRNHTAKDLATEATIGLDMTRDAFSSPKPLIDFMGDTFVETEVDQEYKDTQTAADVVEEILAISEKSVDTLKKEAEEADEKRTKAAAAKRARARVNKTKQEVQDMAEQQEETQDVNEETINNFDIEAAADEIAKEDKSSEDYRKNKPKFDC